MRFRRISGTFARGSALLLLLLAAGCNYGFRGGGGLPEHVRTVYVAPLQIDEGNAAANIPPALDPQLYRALNERLPRALGLRPAGERNADLIVRCTISRYDDVASNYRPGAQQGTVDVEQHQVTISVSVQLIDVRDNLVRYESTSVQGRGEYRPGSQSDEVARTTAIEMIIQQIVDGAQSQW